MVYSYAGIHLMWENFIVLTQHHIKPTGQLHWNLTNFTSKWRTTQALHLIKSIILHWDFFPLQIISLEIWCNLSSELMYWLISNVVWNTTEIQILFFMGAFIFSIRNYLCCLASIFIYWIYIFNIVFIIFNTVFSVLLQYIQVLSILLYKTLTKHI